VPKLNTGVGAKIEKKKEENDVINISVTDSKKLQ